MPQTLREIIEERFSHKNRRVRADAIRFISKTVTRDPIFGSHDIKYARGKIEDMRHDQSSKVRSFVPTALLRFKNPTVVPTLMELAQDPEDKVRWAAAAVLQSFYNEDVEAEARRLFETGEQKNWCLASAMVPLGTKIFSELFKTYKNNPDVIIADISARRLGHRDRVIVPFTSGNTVPYETFLATFLAAACADALGRPLEFKTKEYIARKHGRVSDYVDKGNMTGVPSDDTDEALLVTQGMVSEFGFDTEIFASLMAQSVFLIDRAEKFDPGYGKNTRESCRKLYAGVGWKLAAGDYDTCAGAMRVHPVGLSYAHDSDGLKKAARLSCRITHNNTEAIAGTKVAAYVVARLANPDYVLDVKELIKEAVEVAKEDNVLVANKITRIHDYLFLNTEDSLETLGTSSRTIDTVPAALYCFLKTPADTEQTVVSAVNVEGDSDSIGAIAGAFSGAYNGIDSIPQRWLDGLQQKQEIINAAQKLYDAVNA